MEDDCGDNIVGLQSTNFAVAGQSIELTQQNASNTADKCDQLDEEIKRLQVEQTRMEELLLITNTQ